MFENLDESNFLLYAAKFYDNPSCESYEEFEKDLSRIKYIKRLFKKYKEDSIVRERLILNHLIVLYNTFYPESCTRMLCLKLDDYLDCLKPFLIYLNYWPDRIDPIKGVAIIGSDINMDMAIVNQLRKLK